MSDSFRTLPAVSTVLAASETLVERFGHARTVAAIRRRLDQLRERLGAGASLDGAANIESIAMHAERLLSDTSATGLEPVINATGIVLHTNLGRATLADAAAQAAMDAARRYVCLEFDPETGARSHRIDAVRDQLTQLTGAQDATAVNNCAAATVLTLRALASGREVIVSRGELIEIGGSFRLPEIMASSGAVLREVGTTNITRTADYARAIGPSTALILRAHQSNYRIRGFTEAPALAELVELGRQHAVPVIDDIGSGSMLDLTPWGLSGEPVARHSIATGADLVLFSGDKLLGGPQAGIIVGRGDLVRRIDADPLMRAVRLDKMSLAALRATLDLYADASIAQQQIPILRMLTTPTGDLRKRAETIAANVNAIPGLSVAIREVESFMGGGSVPDQAIPSIAFALRHRETAENELARRLRMGTPRVIGRVQNGEMLLDLRTVFPEQDEALVSALRAAFPSRADA